MRYVLAATICVLLFAGCGGGDDAATPSTTQHAIDWEGVPEPRPRDGVLAVDAFRSYLRAVEAEWEREPEAVVRRYLRIDDGALTVDGTRAILLRDSLEDDSVAAERWVLELERDGENWSLHAARWEQRCHQGRGHQEFGNELCL